MKHYLPALFVISLLAFTVPAMSQAKDPVKEPPKEAVKEVNITGVWETTVQTQNGDMVSDATFTQEKDKLKVSATGPQGMALTGEGTVKDGVAKWSLTISTPNGDFTIFFSAKIDGEKMTGEAQMGDYGTAPWSAIRKKK
jgi:hypothetical protein